MLEVRQLKRSYGDMLAVDNVEFSISDGEVVGLLGHNGAGKTTIMKMLSGYLEPDSGSIRIDDMDLLSDAKPVQRQLGYLPENLPVYPEMTVADYLDYSASVKGIQSNHYSEINRVVAAVEIGDKLSSPIGTLSRGYKQRVGVAQALLGQPRLLILDEPTNGLDPTQTGHMRQLIKNIAASATVILSTHIMQEVDAVCDRVLLIRNGRLAVDARLEDLRRSNSLLVSTSLDREQAHSILTRLTEVASLEQIPGAADSADGVFDYRLHLNEGSDLHRAGAAVAKSVADVDAALYRLTPEQRDLETLFREVNQVSADISGEGLNDAA
ncbi:MAG TPA: multidrug ABC transporter ATP-binding protein [Porticoccaceae bacterium]|nr:multidrug ABC transporter ATP-binding protein [Porticoccaceae bacterium]